MLGSHLKQSTSFWWSVFGSLSCYPDRTLLKKHMCGGSWLADSCEFNLGSSGICDWGFSASV